MSKADFKQYCAQSILFYVLMKPATNCLNVRRYVRDSKCAVPFAFLERREKYMQNLLLSEPLLLTVPQVAQRLGVSQRLVRELIARHTLPSVKIGGARRVPVAQLNAYLSALMADAR